MKAHVITPPLMDDRELSRLPVSFLKDGGVTDFDLYVDIGGHKILYAPCPYRWSSGEVVRLQADGHEALYFSTKDAGKAKAFQRLSAIAKVDESLPPRQRVAQITELAAELTRALYEHPLSTASMAKGKEITEALVRCIDEDPYCIQALGKLADHDQYTYYHSARVAAYALAIAMRLGDKDQSNLREIALGCLLHDIGKTKIDPAIINKNEPLTEKEWAIMKKHPEYGVEVLKDQALSVVAYEIILHHHERFDGKGYPHGLGRNEIMLEVNIAAFCDVFDALTTPKPYQPARTKYEALNFIRFHMLDEFFNEPYKAMVELLKEDKV